MDPSNTKRLGKKENQTTHYVRRFPQLPDEIMLKIFLKIPFTTLVNCCYVCKSWSNILSHPEFARLRYSTETSNIVLFNYFSNLYVLDDKGTDLAQFKPPRDFKFINSCNGLICMRSHLTIYVMNPVTGEGVRFPLAKGTYKIDLCGFGCSRNTNQYKLFRVVCYDIDSACAHDFRDEYAVLENAVAQVYTLGTGTWRRIEDAHLQESVLGSAQIISHTYLNGCLYFYAVYRDRNILATFDFETEQFKRLKDIKLFSRDCFLGLGTFGDHLCVCRYAKPNGVKVLLLKGSWTKHTLIKFPRELELDERNVMVVKHFENGDILLLQLSELKLYLVSPLEGSYKSFTGFRLRYDNVITLVPSLIPLRDVLKGETLEESSYEKLWNRIKLRPM